MNFSRINTRDNKITRYKINKIILLVLILVSFAMVSCSSDDGTPAPVQNNITYAGDVKAILDANCLN